MQSTFLFGNDILIMKTSKVYVVSSFFDCNAKRGQVHNASDLTHIISSFESKDTSSQKNDIRFQKPDSTITYVERN